MRRTAPIKLRFIRLMVLRLSVVGMISLDTKNYREVISNPWSWFFTAEMLYQNADALYGLYNLGRLRDIELWKEMRKKYNLNYDLNSPTSILEKMISLVPVDYCDIVYPFYTPSCLTIVSVYMMLMGMAIENMVKGIKVAKKFKDDPDIIDRATLKELEIFGHTAPDLIEELEIAVSDNEMNLLKDANEHLEWAGRYAAPSNASKQILPLPKSVMNLTPVEADEIFEILIALYDRLKDIFEKETSEPPIKDWWENRPNHIRGWV